MNRVIKFRAWDKIYKRMNYKVQVGNTDYADQNYTCNSIWVDYGDRKSAGWMNADDKCIDLMQFTGLKDKNGKEIYEGDIIKCHYFYEALGENLGVYESEKEIVGEIWFQQMALWIESNNETDSGYLLWINGLHEESFEIIGNIHENPELL